jgi:hypothetical protein
VVVSFLGWSYVLDAFGKVDKRRFLAQT